MPPSDSNPTKDRSYVMLEEFDLVALLRTQIDDKDLLDRVEDALPTGDHTVYRRLGTATQARNSKQARRKAANRAYEGVDADKLPDRLVSVPVKNWQPGPVTSSTSLRVG
jgi:hypothetical protein